MIWSAGIVSCLGCCRRLGGRGGGVVRSVLDASVTLWVYVSFWWFRSRLVLGGGRYGMLRPKGVGGLVTICMLRWLLERRSTGLEDITR